MRKYVVLIFVLCLTASMGLPKEDTTPMLTETFSNEWMSQTVGDTLKYQKNIQLSDQIYATAVRKGGVIVKFDSIIGVDTLRLNGKVVDSFSRKNMPRGSFFTRRYYVPASILQKGDNQLDLKVVTRALGNNLNRGMQSGLREGNTLTISTVDIVDQLAMTYNVADEDYIFLGNDVMTFTINVANTNPWSLKGDLVVKMTTDKHESVSEATKPIVVQTNSSTGETFKMKAPTPGFYHFTVELVRNGNTLMKDNFNLGYEPEKIHSPVDTHDDFKAFWDKNLKELAKVPLKYQMTLVPEASNNDYEMYLVQMQSLDNKTIRGYYAKPKREGKFPVMVEYMGYGSNPYYASTKWDGFAHYVPSIRGQGLNRLTKEDDFWLTIGLKDKQGYYYQGGFCDVVRAIDFVCSRPEVDTEKVVARGGSQGGALSFVAAALDKRVKVCAPSIPFLSDYRDYFAIAPWPKSDFDNYAKSHPEFTWEQTYDLLTYFDIKNLAPWITCPLIMSFGVQDPTCPPHINFAAYNQVKSEKVWVACPRSGHNTDAHAGELEHKFILSHLGLPVE